MNSDSDANILPYEPRPAWTGNGASLTQADGNTVITFPIPGTWTVWATAAWQLLIAISQMGNIVLLAWMMRSMPSSMQLPRSTIGWAALGLVTTVLGVLEGVHTLRRYFRWGLISRTLTFGPEAITDRWLGRNRMRERIRRTSDLKELKLSTERDLLMRRRIARIYVRFRTGFPRSIIIPADSPQAAEQMLQTLERAIAARKP